MTVVNVNDSDIHYSDTGEGEVIVLVYGLSAGFDMWQPQIKTFSNRYRVIAINVRGVGRSDKLIGWKNILEQVEDLRILLDHLDIDQAVICGVSYVGVFTQKLTHPEYCKAVAIIDSYSTTRIHNFKDFLWLISVYAEAPSNLLPNKWLSGIMKKLYKPWPEAARILSEVTEEFKDYEAMKTRFAINNVNFTPELKKVNIPALCAVGTESWLLSIP